MKIGLVSFHAFSQPGGVKSHVLGLYKEFKKRGIETKIIAPRRNKNESYGKDVILLGTSLPLHFSGGKSDLCFYFNPLAIEKALKKEKFDILHFQNHGFLAGLQMAERSNATNILTFHADVEGSEFLKIFPFPLYLLKKIVQWKADGVIGVSSVAIKPFKNYRGPKIIIPNGVDTETFGPEAEKLKEPPFDDPSRIKILFVGRIEKRKGLIYLLRAYRALEKKFSNLSLVIVGQGELEQNCRLFVKKNNLKEVYFRTRVEGRGLPSFYASSDIFCSPALFGESFGIVLLEAMTSGLPVVAFANKGYKEFLGKKRGGDFLAKPGDWDGLAQKLEILIKNPRLRKEMGDWGRKEAQNYSWPKIADRVLDFYRLCAKKEAPKKPDFLPISVEKIIDLFKV